MMRRMRYDENIILSKMNTTLHDHPQVFNKCVCEKKCKLPIFQCKPPLKAIDITSEKDLDTCWNPGNLF